MARNLLVATEKQELKAVLDWLSWQRMSGKPLVFCHPPNERTSRGAPRLGVRAGLPDILVFTPPLGQRGTFGQAINYSGVAVELKRAHGGRVTAEQLRWLEDLRDAGWSTALCEGAEEAIAFLTPLYVLKQR
jgi:hypothetical protein